MKVECAECNAAEDLGSAENKRDAVVIDAVCHHCGKPLCQHHRIAVADPAFAGTRWSQPSAYHCAACKKRHHGG